MVRDHDAAGFSRASLTRHPSISAGPLPCIYASTNDAPDEAILCFVEPVFKELMHLVPTLLLSADEQANCINWLQQLVDLSQDDMAEVVSGLDSLYDAAVKARNIWFIRYGPSVMQVWSANSILSLVVGLCSLVASTLTSSRSRQRSSKTRRTRTSWSSSNA